MPRRNHRPHESGKGRRTHAAYNRILGEEDAGRDRLKSTVAHPPGRITSTPAPRSDRTAVGTGESIRGACGKVIWVSPDLRFGWINLNGRSIFAHCSGLCKKEGDWVFLGVGMEVVFDVEFNSEHGRWQAGNILPAGGKTFVEWAEDHGIPRARLVTEMRIRKPHDGIPKVYYREPRRHN